MYLWANMVGEYDEMELRLPSLSKLDKVLKMIPSDEIDIEVKNNHLNYKDDKIKFKYHLYDVGILTKPKLSLEKINSFKYDVDFCFSGEFLSDLLKNSSITGTDKLYISTEDGKLVWKLADQTITNSDTFTIVGSEVDFDMEPFIVKLDNMKRLAKIKDAITKFSYSQSIGVGNIVIQKDDISLNYIMSSMVK